MVINEKGLLRAMKEAYKADGYEIECKEVGGEKEIHLETTRWYVMCILQNLPRKVLGLIAEHMGDLPTPGQAVQVKKKECQTKLITEHRDAFRGVTPDDCINPPTIHKTALVYRYSNIWQQARGHKVFWVDPDLEDIMNLHGKVVCLGEKVLNLSGTHSSVSIAPSDPQKAEDKRMLEYLANIQLYER